MALAGFLGSVGTQAVKSAGDTMGAIAKEGATTIFGALGNLINEDYNKRMAAHKTEQQITLETAQEKLKRGTMNILNEYDKQKSILDNKLTKDLNEAKTDNEIKKANNDFVNSLKLLDSTTRSKIEQMNAEFENQKKLFEMQTEQQVKQKDIERARQKELLDYQKQMSTMNRDELLKLTQFLKNRILISADPQERASLTQQLTQAMISLESNAPKNIPTSASGSGHALAGSGKTKERLRLDRISGRGKSNISETIPKEYADKLKDLGLAYLLSEPDEDFLIRFSGMPIDKQLANQSTQISKTEPFFTTQNIFKKYSY